MHRNHPRAFELGASQQPAVRLGGGPAPATRPIADRAGLRQAAHDFNEIAIEEPVGLTGAFVERLLEHLAPIPRLTDCFDGRHQALVWREARDLRPGDRIVTADGEAEVISVRPYTGSHQVYNLEVEHPSHTYLVAGHVVHNKKLAGGGTLTPGLHKVGELGWEFVLNGRVIPHPKSVEMEQHGMRAIAGHYADPGGGGGAYIGPINPDPYGGTGNIGRNPGGGMRVLGGRGGAPAPTPAPVIQAAAAAAAPATQAATAAASQAAVQAATSVAATTPAAAAAAAGATGAQPAAAIERNNKQVVAALVDVRTDLQAMGRDIKRGFRDSAAKMRRP